MLVSHAFVCLCVALVDHKKTLCAYFKAGVCEKGKKCKFSHDLALEDSRSIAIDLYSDPRAKVGKVPDTIITCRDFLDAVERELYGFNWVCPNGGDNCQYRHMLPQGYVLNRDKNKRDDEESSEEEMTLEEKIEAERQALPSEGLTPVTYESFMKWKADREARKQEELAQKIAAEEAKGKKDKSQMHFMSGRALFQFNPDLFEDAADAGEDDIVFEEDEQRAAAQQDDDSEEETKERESDDEERKEAKPLADDGGDDVGGPAVQVDQDLFAGEDAGADEDVDFD